MSTSQPRRAKTTAASTAGSFAEKPQSAPEVSLEPTRTRNPDGSVEYRLKGLLHNPDGPAYIGADGTKHWFISGIRHRVGGPAVEHADGKVEYWFGGVRHNTDGPAVIGAAGGKRWMVHDVLHRIDGPAVEMDGYKSYHLHGWMVTKEQFERFSDPAAPVPSTSADGTVTYRVDGHAHRLDGPAIEYADGATMWMHNGVSHRTDGPAYEHPAIGFAVWCSSGKKHRIGGPAVTNEDGSVEYWLHGHRVSEAEYRALTGEG